MNSESIFWIRSLEVLTKGIQIKLQLFIHDTYFFSCFILVSLISTLRLFFFIIIIEKSLFLSNFMQLTKDQPERITNLHFKNAGIIFYFRASVSFPVVDNVHKKFLTGKI